MFMIYKNRKAAKAPGCWYSYNYDSGQRVTPCDLQGDIEDLESHAKWLSLEKKREIRLIQHYEQGGKMHRRIYGIYREGRKIQWH